MFEENSLSPLEKSQGRRKLSNLILNPKIQLQSSLEFLAVGFILTSILFGVVVSRVIDTLDILANLNPPSENVSELAESSKVALWSVYGIAVSCSVLASIGVSLVITHRYVGPIVPIQRQLRKLISGDFSGQITLRDGDAFRDLADDVNQLTSKLAQK